MMGIWKDAFSCLLVDVENFTDGPNNVMKIEIYIIFENISGGETCVTFFFL